MNNHEIIKNLQPLRVWELFAELGNIPRPSFHEEQVKVWLKKFAEKNNLKWRQDAIGNLAIYKNAQHSKSKKTLLLQAHMDMVCQKADDIEFDFLTDPIKFRLEGDHLFATKTTLGSDNGVGLAMILAILEDQQISHPIIQALFTMDEEENMVGSNNLDTSLIEADYMINLDTEVESMLMTSCAGSRDIEANLKLNQISPAQNSQSYDLIVSGLRGGHSGINVQENRVSAIKLTSALIGEFQNVLDLLLIAIDGGSARNSIPRNCKARFNIENITQDDLTQFQNIIEFYKKNYVSTEPDLEITLQKSDLTELVFDSISTNKMIKLINSIHSGVYQMSADIPTLVQTSANLGIISTKNDIIELLFMVRSSDTFELKVATSEILSQFELVVNQKLKLDLSNLNLIHSKFTDLEIKLTRALTGWKHDPHNPLIQIVSDLHESILGFKPKIEAVHAGLECGALKSYLPNCHIISFGPTIENAHSPQESVEVKSVESCFKLLRSVISKLSEEI